MRIWGRYFLLGLGVILMDQLAKFWVYHNMELGVEGQIVLISDWLKLHYTTNLEMAFGLKPGLGRPALFLIRSGLILIIGLFIFKLARNRVQSRVVWSMALIWGGAIGNLIDSALYGVLLGNAPDSATSPWFNGRIIDIIYLDLWKGIVPQDFPILGGRYLTLLPIFNLADLAIFVGVISILLTSRPYRTSS